MPVPIVWAPVLQAGAEALAAAIGAAVGQKIGNLIPDLPKLIIGVNQIAADLAELDQRLRKVEEKIEEIFQYLVEKLPGVIYANSLAATIDMRVADIEAKRTGIRGAIAIFRDSGSSDDAKAIHALVVEMLNAAEGLMRLGAPSYVVAIDAMICATSAYKVLIDHDPKYGEDLKVRSTAWCEIINPWLNENMVGTIPYNLKAYLAAYAEAKRITEHFNNGLPFFMLAVQGPQLNTVNGVTTYTYEALIGWLDEKDAQGRWFCESSPKWITRSYPVPLQTWGTFLEVPVPWSNQKPIQLDFYPAFNPLPITTSPKGALALVAAQFNERWFQMEQIPAIVGAGDQALTAIHWLFDACNHYSLASTLAPDDMKPS